MKYSSALIALSVMGLPFAAGAADVALVGENLDEPGVLGRRDEPTDAVRDYANCLSEALRRQGIVCENSEVPWHERGWLVAV